MLWIITVDLDSDVMNHHCRFGFGCYESSLSIWNRCYERFHHYCMFGFGCYESSLSIWIRCYERFIIGLDSLLWEIHYRIGFVVMRDFIIIGIWILSPAVYIYRRSELTADSFLSLDVSFFNRSYLSKTINIPVHLYSPRLRRRYRRSILTAAMLGLRSVNEWKHGAKRSAVASEQPSIFTLRDFVAASPVHSYGGNADLIPIIGWPEMNHITITGSYYALIMLSYIIVTVIY